MHDAPRNDQSLTSDYSDSRNPQNVAPDILTTLLRIANFLVSLNPVRVTIELLKEFVGLWKSMRMVGIEVDRARFELSKERMQWGIDICAKLPPESKAIVERDIVHNISKILVDKGKKRLPSLLQDDKQIGSKQEHLLPVKPKRQKKKSNV